MTKKLRLVLSLLTDANDYQQEMAAAARSAATKLGVQLEVLYAQNDPIRQIQDLLNVIQEPSNLRADAILFEPAGGSMTQVARAAAVAGMGVVGLNWRVDYVQELRKKYPVPSFTYNSDHTEIGRIQAQQIGALLPNGGRALYIHGPSSSTAAQNRLTGMMEKKPANVQTKVIKASAWTEEAGRETTSFWLSFSTSQSETIDLVVGQNDLLAMGARKAFSEVPNAADRDRWLKLPFMGVDGLPKTGQLWVHQHLLAATVAVPPIAGAAIEALVRAFQSRIQPPECILAEPKSFPSVDELRRRRS